MTRTLKWNTALHRRAVGLVGALLVAGATLAGTNQALGEPRPPGAPLPETGCRTFSEPWNQPYEFAQDHAIDPAVWGESWSGYCLDRTSAAVTPWSAPMALTNRTLVDPASGAIRFWYRPAFGSGGPGHVARLLSLVSASGGTSAT